MARRPALGAEGPECGCVEGQAGGEGRSESVRGRGRACDEVGGTMQWKVGMGSGAWCVRVCGRACEKGAGGGGAIQCNVRGLGHGACMCVGGGGGGGGWQCDDPFKLLV